MATVTLKNVHKKYDNGFIAVKDFNLEIKDGEFVVLVGPSGCGKSTTLRMIAGLEEISAGEIYMDDKLVNEVEPKDRDIAMVFQNYALYPQMTVKQNISYALRLRKIPKDVIEAKVKEVAKTLGLEDYLDRKPKTLSGGQRQRVALGRAIARSPKIFLMDEPLSNLDAKLRGQMRVEISKLHRQLDCTFIYVTHDQTEAMTMGDRIVVMKDGVIHQIDEPEELYYHPNNMFVAGFIGMPQINFFKGELIHEDQKLKVILEQSRVKVELNDNFHTENVFNYVGKEIVIGARPESIISSKTELIHMSDSIEAEVSVFEMLGSESYIYFDFEGQTITAQLASKEKYSVGDKVYINFDAEKLILFDAETEERIVS